MAVNQYQYIIDVYRSALLYIFIYNIHGYNSSKYSLFVQVLFCAADNRFKHYETKFGTQFIIYLDLLNVYSKYVTPSVALQLQGNYIFNKK